MPAAGPLQEGVQAVEEGRGAVVEVEEEEGVELRGVVRVVQGVEEGGEGPGEGMLPQEEAGGGAGAAGARIGVVAVAAVAASKGHGAAVGCLIKGGVPM